MTTPKPCPFCGSADLSVCGMSRALGGFWVECQSGTCWAEGPRGATEAEALAAWNRALRPEPAAQCSLRSDVDALIRTWNHRNRFTETARELIGRAVKHPGRFYTHTQRWVAVRLLFGLGSTGGHALCRIFGEDPDEDVSTDPMAGDDRCCVCGADREATWLEE